MAAGWLIVPALIFTLHRVPPISDWPAFNRALRAMVLAAPLIALAVLGGKAVLRP